MFFISCQKLFLSSKKEIKPTFLESEGVRLQVNQKKLGNFKKIPKMLGPTKNIAKNHF